MSKPLNHKFRKKYAKCFPTTTMHTLRVREALPIEIQPKQPPFVTERPGPRTLTALCCLPRQKCSTCGVRWKLPPNQTKTLGTQKTPRKTKKEKDNSPGTPKTKDQTKKRSLGTQKRPFASPRANHRLSSCASSGMPCHSGSSAPAAPAPPAAPSARLGAAQMGCQQDSAGGALCAVGGSTGRGVCQEGLRVVFRACPEGMPCLSLFGLFDGFWREGSNFGALLFFSCFSFVGGGRGKGAIRQEVVKHCLRAKGANEALAKRGVCVCVCVLLFFWKGAEDSQRGLFLPRPSQNMYLFLASQRKETHVSWG